MTRALQERSTLAALTALLAIAVPVATADELRDRLPAPVAQAVDANRPGAAIRKIDIEKHDGLVLYDIEFRDDQGEMEVAEDGTVLDVVSVVQMKEVPEAAAAVIEKASEGRTIKRVERSEVRNRIKKEAGKGTLEPLGTFEYVYEAEFKKGGEIEVAADGRILKAPK